LEPDFKQCRASVNGKAVLFRVEVELTASAATAGEKLAKDGPQMRRVKGALKTLYPPDGRVPDNVSTKRLRAQFAAHLASDSKNRGLADPSWDVVHRARGAQ